METFYKAIDGTVFETASDCQKYEEEHFMPKMWDIYKKETKDIEEAYYIHITAPEQWQWLEEDFGVSVPSDNGIDSVYLYEEETHQEWYGANEYANKLEREAREAQEKFEKFKPSLEAFID